MGLEQLYVFRAIKTERKNENEHFKDATKVGKHTFVKKNALYLYYWVRDHSCRYVYQK